MLPSNKQPYALLRERVRARLATPRTCEADFAPSADFTLDTEAGLRVMLTRETFATDEGMIDQVHLSLSFLDDSALLAKFPWKFGPALGDEKLRLLGRYLAEHVQPELAKIVPPALAAKLRAATVLLMPPRLVPHYLIPWDPDFLLTEDQWQSKNQNSAKTPFTPGPRPSAN